MSTGKSTGKQLTVEQRVANGVKFLDKVARGWWEEGRLDLSTLKLSNGERCICGQVFTNPTKRPSRSWRVRVAKKMGLQPFTVRDAATHFNRNRDDRAAGYWWAQRTLFTEGAQWIEAAVDINGDNPVPEEIARRLGFLEVTRDNILSGYTSARGGVALFSQLEREWVRVIQERRAKKAEREMERLGINV